MTKQTGGTSTLIKLQFAFKIRTKESYKSFYCDY